MSTPGTPLTRRQLRELEAARLAAQGGAATGSGEETTTRPSAGEGAPDARSAAGREASAPTTTGTARVAPATPAAAPAAGAAAPSTGAVDAAATSRRALRNRPVAAVGPDGQTAGQGGAPYQVPGLHPETPARTRRSIRSTDDTAATGSAPNSAGTDESAVVSGAGAGSRAATQSTTGALAGARSWNPLGAAPSSAPLAPSASTAGPTGESDEATPPRGTPVTAPATVAGNGGASSEDSEQDVPDWRSLLKAMAPPPGPAQEVAETGSIPVVSIDEVDAEPDEVPERIRRPLPFTWLQWIILILVFFVLGFLIVLVGKTAAGADGDLAPTLATAAALWPAPLT
ncbi:hypothetical protein [Cellulomonas sp. NPDC089187]|uniref:hypothetical protein n=1 Tax=Cellulomonas sp. NPDC089187 TaxID=3154970 RepID=UPI00341C3F06